MYKYPVYKPFIGAREKEYVNQCLDSTWISSKGAFIQKFEDEFAKYTGSAHALSCTNGTVALHLALEALEITTGDEVIVPTLTYIASVNAITYTGATPVFADSENAYWQIDPQDVERKITEKTKALIVVHLYGQPSNMEALLRIAQKHKLFIIEDCAEAFGATFKGTHVGSFGDIATYSFFGNKTITTGEGGMVTTNNKELAKKVFSLKGQGLAEGREYWHDTIGYNYRMTNIACAIGLAQLERADQILAQKRAIACWYNNNLSSLPIQFHEEAEDYKHSYWMCSFLVEKKEQRDPLRAFLLKKGIETRPLFFPVHQMPIYATNTSYPVAEDLAYRGITLPSYPELSQKDVESICETINLWFEIRG
ncbi:MAG: perosamine synthetase [Candidatus Azotimanducaceae bacterium]|jgi:perosamine synthetase